MVGVENIARKGQNAVFSLVHHAKQVIVYISNFVRCKTFWEKEKLHSPQSSRVFQNYDRD